jgi:hypothetical protein
MTPQESALCETIKRFGYAKNAKVRLYGKVLEIISDPVCFGDECVSFRARDLKSGCSASVRIPLNIVRMASEGNRAA